MHSNMEHVCHCAAELVCCSHPISVHASVHEFMSLPDCPCLLHPIWTITWKHGWPCVALGVCHNQPISDHTPLLECVHASVHVLMFIWLPISVWCLVDSYMERCVPLCSTACVYSNYSISGNIPWLEFVHASVHVFMSIWLLVSPQTPMHSYTDPWEPPCGSVFVSQSPHYVASTCMECVHASVHVLMWMWVLKFCSISYA